MGVYVRRMKMPDCCWNCPCFMEERDECFVTKEDIEGLDGLSKRLDTCPLIELPDHGDLIERPILIDELAISEEPDDCRGCATYNSYGDFCDRSLDFQNMCRSIRTAPIVIPAERIEENDRKNHN